MVARSILNSWRVAFKPRHSIAMLPRWANVVALGRLHRRHIRAAAGLVAQEDRGLTPGAILGIKGAGIVRPEEVPDTDGEKRFSCSGCGREPRQIGRKMSRFTLPL